MNFITQFASEEGPHISLKAEKVFEIGGIEITNSYLYGLIISLLITSFIIWVSKKSQIRAVSGIVQFVEYILEFLIDAITPILGSKEKAYKYAPFFGTFFIFIVLTNLSGLLPLVGEGILVDETPAFRPFTADLNGTIALSVVAIVLVQVLSIKESGFLGHLKHYFTDKPLNPINLFIGFLEVFGELTRVASLSLRLFLNTAVGEILIAVFAYIGGYGLTFTLLPIVTFEILVALIQAYVFTILSATYLGLAIAHGDSHEEDHDHATDDVHESPSLIPAESDA